MSNDVQETDAQSFGSPANVIYILYLAGLVFGITVVVGLIIAYVNRNDAPEWLRTHYRYQIRTFWLGLFYTIVGILLVALVIGWAILLIWWICFVIRCAKGMKHLARQEPVPNVTSWFI